MEAKKEERTVDEPLVKYQKHHELIEVTLNRPKALNALNLEMIQNLTSHISFINEHQVLWLQGAGGRSFCSGGDVKSIFLEGSTDELRLNFFQKEFTLDYRMSQLKALQIAVWDGYVMGGGLGISCHAPIIIATEKTVLAMPESKLGFFGDVGVTHVLARMRNNLGYYLGVTGLQLKGEQVFIAGLAHFYIQSGKLSEVFGRLCDSLQEKVNNVKQLVTSILKEYHKSPEKLTIQHEHQIHQLFSLKSVRQIYLILSAKSTEFPRTVVKAMRDLNPLSMELTFRLIQQAKEMTLKEVLVRDYNVVEHMVGSADFREGVKCVLIEKTGVPKWTIPDLKSLPEEEVDRFMKPLFNSPGLYFD